MTPLSKPTVEDHVDGLFLERTLQVGDLRWLRARDDDEHVVKELQVRNWPVGTFRYDTRARVRGGSLMSWRPDNPSLLSALGFVN